MCPRACLAVTRAASIATTEMGNISREAATEETMKAMTRSWLYLVAPLVFWGLYSLALLFVTWLRRAFARPERIG